MKVFILFLFIFSLVSSAQSSQKVILNNLFDQLQIINNSKSAALLEQKIWSIWNEHPSDFKSWHVNRRSRVHKVKEVIGKD